MTIYPSTLTEVATASGVSPATVSNVLNYPHKVKAETLQRVLRVIQDLDYHPNERAVLLRLGSRKRQNPTVTAELKTKQQQTPNGEVKDNCLPKTSVPKTLSTRHSWHTFESGQRVTVTLNARTASGIVDVVMADGSAVWIWMDDCAGRRLVHQDDGNSVV